MGPSCLVALALTLAIPPDYEAVDARVVQVRMPLEDVTLLYVELKGGMAVELRAVSAAVSGTRQYVGDGTVAVPLAVEPGRGIVFQGTQALKQGFRFTKGSEVAVRPGYKRAGELRPGDVYVTLPGVWFELPAKPARPD